MALLERYPDQQTIMALRGHVDIYKDHGQFVARSWPVKSRQPRTRRSIESSELFTAAAAWTGGLSDNMVLAYRAQVVGQGITWIDYQRGLARGQSWIEWRPPS